MARRRDPDADGPDLIEVVPVGDAGPTPDEELAEPPATHRLTGRGARVAAAAAVALLLALVLVRALTAGGGSSPAAGPSAAPATAGATSGDVPSTSDSRVNECTSFSCLRAKRTSLSGSALDALHHQFRSARIISSETDLYPSTGALKYRKIIAQDGLRHIVVVLRPHRAGDRHTGGYQDDGGASSVFLETRLGGQHVRIRVSVPTGAVQLDLVPLTRLAADRRLLDLG